MTKSSQRLKAKLSLRIRLEFNTKSREGKTEPFLDRWFITVLFPLRISLRRTPSCLLIFTGFAEYHRVSIRCRRIIHIPIPKFW